jgi:hypothetical protein
LLEIAFFGLGLYTLYRQKWLAFGCVIFFSSLNRETAVFIPALYWLTFVENSIHDNRLIKDARVYFRGMIFILIWLGIFLGLRLWLGSAPHVVDPKETILLNLTAPNLIKTLIAGVLFLGPFWLFILPGFIHAPRFIRTTFFVIPFYLVPYLIWGYWYETRVLMALYPLLIATGLFAIFKPANGNLSDREGIPDE